MTCDIAQAVRLVHYATLHGFNVCPTAPVFQVKFIFTKKSFLALVRVV